jgi:hypothetical protein
MTPSMTEVSGTWRTETPPTAEARSSSMGAFLLFSSVPVHAPGRSKQSCTRNMTILIRGAEPIVSKDTHSAQSRYKIRDVVKEVFWRW